MEHTTVIKRPLITEKTTYHSGAANRYAELKTLLTDSGLEVRQRQSPGSAAGLPGGGIRRQ